MDSEASRGMGDVMLAGGGELAAGLDAGGMLV